jgi:hypothetical protein
MSTMRAWPSSRAIPHRLTSYRAVVKGGAMGGVAGLVLGTAGVLFASRRFPGFRHLTVPFRVFIPVSIGTFACPSPPAYNRFRC